MNRNLYVDQGSIFSSEFVVKQDDGSVADLSGYSARGKIKKSYSSASGVDMNAVVNSPINGKISVLLTAETTSGMKPGCYVYDVVVDNSNGTVIRVVEGILVVTPGVTQ